jgi:hypothetical protein
VRRQLALDEAADRRAQLFVLVGERRVQCAHVLTLMCSYSVMAAHGARTGDHLMMDTTDAEMTSKPTPASRVRQALAGLIDAGVTVLPTVVYGLRAWRARGTERPAARPPDWMRMLAPAFAVLGEQVGTPGGWIAGVRTVDRRTGRRLALWRTLAVTLVQVATRVLSRRLTPRPVLPSEGERRQRASEVSFWPPLIAGLGSTLVNRAVRRRLAPTLVVSRRPAE